MLLEKREASMKDYAEYDATGLADLVSRGEVSAAELLTEATSRAEKAQADLEQAPLEQRGHHNLLPEG